MTRCCTTGNPPLEVAPGQRKTHVNSYRRQTMHRGKVDPGVSELPRGNELSRDHVNRPLEALYVDDLSSGDNTVNRCFELYKKTVNCFHSGGFQLHKWASNSQDLMKLIESDEISERSDEPQPKAAKFGSLENEQ